ncbi:MAG TPA: hypothetical protein VLZ05_07345 [Mycobacterium sp.]|nr:hypothetical protein [Mycobacterium sp.]HUH68706.1 hypothetical protein [Mycobacterium sp.]
MDTLGEREWRKLSGTQIAPGAEGGRQSWDDVVLVGRMLNKMRELNPDVPAEYLDQAHAAIIQPQSQDAIADAKNFVLKYYNVCCAYRCATQSSRQTLTVGQPTKGFFTEIAEPNRPKSRSADHNSRTPCAAHKAAIRASCTIDPMTFPAVSVVFSRSQ